MDIWDANKLALFIAFIIPGFISLKTYELLLPAAIRDSDKQLIDAVAYSSVNYALMLGPIFFVETYQVRQLYPAAYILFYVSVLFVAPIVWAYVMKRLRSTDFFQRSMPHPIAKPWDYFFSKRNAYWVIVTLKDGKKFAGRYDSESFASSSPAPEQLYLEEAWVLNTEGGFERPRLDSAGILILSSEIIAVEFFNITNGENSGREQTTTKN